MLMVVSFCRTTVGYAGAAGTEAARIEIGREAGPMPAAFTAFVVYRYIVPVVRPDV
jgi:hypothetical protein